MPGRLGPAPSTAPARLLTHRPLLMTRDFGLVWSGQLISQIGDGISKLALLWFVYAITGSPLKTSIIGLLQTIPPIVLGPVIGVYVDRLPKKLLLIVSDLLRALLIGLFPVSSRLNRLQSPCSTLWFCCMPLRPPCSAPPSRPRYRPSCPGRNSPQPMRFCRAPPVSGSSSVRR